MINLYNYITNYLYIFYKKIYSKNSNNKAEAYIQGMPESNIYNIWYIVTQLINFTVILFLLLRFLINTVSTTMFFIVLIVVLLFFIYLYFLTT